MENKIKPKGLWRIFWTTLKFGMKTAIFSALFVFAFILFFFAYPEIRFREGEIDFLLKRFLPAHAEVRYREIELRILNTEAGFFTKRLSLEGSGLCVNFRNRAVRFCSERVEAGAVVGWDRSRRKGDGWFFPRPIPGLVKLDAVKILSGDLYVNRMRLKKEREALAQQSEGDQGLDLVSYLRKEVLPRWVIFGSDVRFESLAVVSEKGEELKGRASFATDQEKNLAVFELQDWRRYSPEAKANDLQASARIEVKRPEQWVRNTSWESSSEPWHVRGFGSLRWDRRKALEVEALADFRNWRSVNLDIRSRLKNVFSLREVRFQGDLKEDDLSGLFSMRLGRFGDFVRTLEFVDCGLKANLATKLGSLRCGPETVTIATREFRPLGRQARGFFVFHPEFLFNATRISFGEEKAVDFELALFLKHQNLIQLNGDLIGSWGTGLRGASYVLKGGLDFVSDSFQRVVRILGRTRYAIPAPLNALDGRVQLASSLDFASQRGGQARYRLQTDLQSRHQDLDLRLEGETKFFRVAGKLQPTTDADLVLERVRLSAPRLDLRALPRLRPDTRFKSVEGEPFAGREEARNPLNLRFHVKTRSKNSLQISSNLTKSPLPIELDLTYDDRPGQLQRRIRAPQRGPASVDQRERGEDPAEQAPVTGKVIFGKTPIEIFRRDAVLNELRLDFLENGERRMNGRVEVSYLDYRIQVLLLGKLTDPRVVFASEPPLDDDQVVAVLLFGRPLEELGADERTSVSNFHSAIANAALGLTSLFFLASTPIESIGYDPVRGFITARVGLGGGASIEVGAKGQGGGTVVGFNKRLAPNWVFRTEVERLGVAGRRTISALVEWVRRF